MTNSDDDEQISFAELGIDERVLRALVDVGYESASPIQAATIPALLSGRHVVGLAQTGTGKTAAFAIPILSQIDLTQHEPQALILAPTRELALQVSEAISKYAHHMPGLNVLAIYGGQSYGIQLAGLRRGAHIVVGTPGRVIDHLNKKTLDLTKLRFLVLDEADEMLQMGFQEDVETILADTPEDKQVALFSATMPSQIRRISKRYLTDAAEITVKSKTMTAANTRQRYIQVANPQKLDALTRVLEVEPFEAMIIFVRTKSATEDLAERLRARGFAAAAINGDLVQAQRERTIGQLKTGDLDILVATDVAARGLDVERISHVLNYDIPHDSESYVHRIGRTGRAGRSGEALMFVTPREKHLLASIERATRQPVTEMPLPTVDDVNTSRVAKFTDAITASLLSPEISLFRGLIEDYQREHNVPVVDVAAALAVLSQEDSFLLKPEPPAPRRAAREGSGERNFDRPDRGPRSDRPDRPRRGDGDDRGRPRRSDVEMATYRIRVGRRQKVMPGSIVGAIANEGGLGRADFGAIDIRVDHTLVELPKDLSASTLAALKSTRISGQLIELALASPADMAPSEGGNQGGYQGKRPSRPGSVGSAGGKKFADKRPSKDGKAKEKKPRHPR
ncbi:ATP-dependent RNA helicase CsdA [Jatrophihabitans sp. GAS493]|uniref:DEAD/DEAH box helicase n=1 Tax=Jatrophihabitans sp. GAS493 TaxID=1907575 RepID=UPI000BB742D1|nr:DEAD/DEAH box helicase [Jatrophihabitans sp. GAS493]SOD74465.1 ATP-dependent RNA helicase CsdA [Jatrophihabitans sp. GAS493]